MRLVAAILATALLGACGSTSPQQAKGIPSLLPSPSKSFNLTVSNQSFRDPKAKISVTIDGRTVVDQGFDVGSQHTFVAFPVDLVSGRHELVAIGPEANYTTNFDLPAKGTRYGVLLYWNYPDETPHFTWDFKSEPPAFG